MEHESKHQAGTGGYSIVVTGGGRGIGRAIVEATAAKASRVVVIERDQAAAEWVGSHPLSDSITVIAGSATDESAISAAIAAATDAAPLSGWVNNAAIFRDVRLDEASTIEFLTALHLNLDPVITGTRGAVRAFISAGTGGSIVNVSSHQATRAVRGAAAYATAKAAIEGFTRAMAVDYGPYGIRVNAVAPGSIRTERSDEYLASLPAEAAADVQALIERVHPLGRIGSAEEVANTVEFLLSPAAGFITGATVPVDGGRVILAEDPEAT